VAVVQPILSSVVWQEVSMSRERRERIIRQFGENGLKLLLEHPDSVRELLSLGEAPQMRRIDFTRMQVDPTGYVSADFRHVVSDLVLTAPLRRARTTHSRRPLWVLILIEHLCGPPQNEEGFIRSADDARGLQPRGASTSDKAH
jgi:hypothetical protein